MQAQVVPEVERAVNRIFRGGGDRSAAAHTVAAALRAAGIIGRDRLECEPPTAPARPFTQPRSAYARHRP